MAIIPSLQVSHRSKSICTTLIFLSLPVADCLRRPESSSVGPGNLDSKFVDHRNPQPDTPFSVGAIRTPKSSRRVSGVRALFFPRIYKRIAHRSIPKTQDLATMFGDGTTQFQSSETNLEINATANTGSTFQN